MNQAAPVGVSVEEAKMTLEGGFQLGLVRIELLENGREGGADSHRLHALEGVGDLRGELPAQEDAVDVLLAERAGLRNGSGLLAELAQGRKGVILAHEGDEKG